MSFLWISLLFSVLYIGSSFERAMSAGLSGFTDDSLQSRFLDRAAEALVTGGYQKARPYSVEAVLAFAYCKFLQKEDPNADACMVMGIAARLALRMGYHRDPRRFLNISPFEGEMRRRVFFLVEAFDLLLSFQAGLPPIIHEDECDIDAPRNLSDEDFDEDCTELPPSRPPTEATSMLYFHYKGTFAKIFRRVIRHALSVKSPNYEDTMRLDQELLAMHNEKPSCLQMKPLVSFTRESVAMIFDILNIDLMYLKCVCVLHRKYITHERSNAKYEYSRERCVDAALRILAHQTELDAACQPGGQYFHDKWMVSSLILYDFILAGIVVCLDLYESRHTSSNASLCYLKVQAQRYDVLMHTRDIWNARKESSRDARRASNVLSVMLSKIPRPAVTCATLNLHEGNGLQPQATDADLMAGLPSSSENPAWYNSEVPLPDEEFGAGNNAVIDFSSALFTESDQIDWVSFHIASLILC
jgi:hypothetical protein